MKKKPFSLTIGWLYPELMSTYGDRGNVRVLQKRCEWRDIGVAVLPIDFTVTKKDILSCDLIFGGGAQDRQQGIVIDDLLKNKGPILKDLFDAGLPGLFVCGAPQLLGHYYMAADGTKLEGLGIFDMVSKHFGKSKPRLIGNIVCTIPDSYSVSGSAFRETIVGFENHGGRTYLGDGVKPFATVVSGFGNNGEDGTEGAVYNHCVATYSHGPFLPKNPHIADWLISRALQRKYKKQIALSELDDTFAWEAHDRIVTRFTPPAAR